MRTLLVSVALATLLAVAGACGGGGSDGSPGGGGDPPAPPPPPPPAIQPTGSPVETRPANAQQTTAFANQTRAPGQRTARIMVFSVVASGLVTP